MKPNQITAEDLEEFTLMISEKAGMPGYIDRIISTKAANLLKKIQQAEPGWDAWFVEAEIYAKAMKLGIKFRP